MRSKPKHIKSPTQKEFPCYQAYIRQNEKTAPHISVPASIIKTNISALAATQRNPLPTMPIPRQILCSMIAGSLQRLHSFLPNSFLLKKLQSSVTSATMACTSKHPFICAVTIFPITLVKMKNINSILTTFFSIPSIRSYAGADVYLSMNMECRPASSPATASQAMVFRAGILPLLTVILLICAILT